MRVRRIILLAVIVTTGLGVAIIASFGSKESPILTHVESIVQLRTFAIDWPQKATYGMQLIEKPTTPIPGVHTKLKDKLFPGLTMIPLRSMAEAKLINKDGKMIHTWKLGEDLAGTWHEVYLCKNGDLLVVAKDLYLARIDWNSKIKWLKFMRAHHDVMEAKNGDIYTLTRKERWILRGLKPLKILDDQIVILSAAGKEKKKSEHLRGC